MGAWKHSCNESNFHLDQKKIPLIASQSITNLSDTGYVTLAWASLLYYCDDNTSFASEQEGEKII